MVLVLIGLLNGGVHLLVGGGILLKKSYSIYLAIAPLLRFTTGIGTDSVR